MPSPSPNPSRLPDTNPASPSNGNKMDRHYVDDGDSSSSERDQELGTGETRAGAKCRAEPAGTALNNHGYIVDLDIKDEDIFDPDSEEVRRVRWKVDKRLLPLLSLLYLCSFLDRVNIGNAKVANLEMDLNLKPGVYNLALSIFFVGYVIGEIPANLMLKKLGPRTWVPMVMFSWGVVSMCMAGIKNGAGLIATRFFLGLAESGFAPGPIYIISLWYRRCEQALRVGVFMSAATVAGAFGGLLSFGISQLRGILGLQAWQWIFLLEGFPTIICCVLAYCFLPEFPETATFLTPEEKELSVKRLRIDAGPATDSQFSWKQFWGVWRDWKLYGHMVIGILHSVTFASLGLFVPSITLGFGFDHVTTQIMTAPVYGFACLFTILLAISSDRFSERGYHGAFSTTVAALGYILLIITRECSTAVRYASLVICTCGVYSFVPIMLSWPSSNIGGQTKKGVALAIIISFAQIGGVAGGQLYRTDDAPLYIRGHTISACVLLLDTFLILGFKHLLRRENIRRKNLTPEEFEKECSENDMTDANPAFRFFE